MKTYDLIVIGAGPGGYTAALKAAKEGMCVAIIDKEVVGGTCINHGCIPTKALIHASKIYHEVSHCEHYGVEAGNVSFNKDRILAYKDGVVKSSCKEIEKELVESGVEIIYGYATIFPDRQVQILKEDGTDEELYGENIIIATGATPVIPPIPGIDLPGVLTSKELLSEQQDMLSDLVIIGGGVVGVECAYIMMRFNQKITIVEKNSRILDPIDPEISGIISENGNKNGIDIKTNTIVKSIEKAGDGLLRCNLYNEVTGESSSVESSHVLVAVGRKPNIEKLFSFNCQIEMENGKIKVNNSFKTSIPNVYAIGDVVSNIQLAHVAAAQGHVVVEQILHKAERTVMLSTVPSCLFIELPIVPSCIYLSPEVATVGLSEAEAKEKGLEVRCGKASIKENLKSILDPDTYGYVKVVFEKRSGVLIGAQMVCPRATDMIGEMATAIANGLTSRQLMYAMRAHPTYNETIAKAVENSQMK